MPGGEEVVAALREAVRVSPENVPLREHLAETLLGLGRADEAEKEYRDALRLAPDSARLKTGLARAFHQQGKHSQAMVVVEDLIRHPACPARALVLHARLLLREGQVDRAVRQYKRAIEADDSAADPELAERLGIRPEADDDQDDDREVVDGRIHAGSGGGQGESITAEFERPTIRFADVGGMEELKDEIRMKIIHPLAHADLFKAYGKPIGGGILLYGPPGCGKTYLARATAGEVRASFLAIGINDVLDMWLGNSERNLHVVFEQARRNRPCVLFFDEVDALAASRVDMRQSAARHLINQFLAEMDGVKESNEGVLILAATNAPWHVDGAFRRPGRFDRILFVPPPDAPARAAILRVLCKGKPVQEIDFDHVAGRTEHFSGADLKALVEAAIEQKLREAMRDGIPRPLTTKDLLAAAGQVRPSTREWFATARNYALYSNQAGTYDDILKYLKL